MRRCDIATPYHIANDLSRDFPCPSFDAKCFAEVDLTRVQLARIGFVIEAAQMQQAVEDELFDLSVEIEAILGGLAI